jgi:hypothetical protein
VLRLVAIWCGRPDSNQHRPFGPTDFLTIYGFRRLASRVRAEASSRSRLSLHLGIRPEKASTALPICPEKSSMLRITPPPHRTVQRIGGTYGCTHQSADYSLRTSAAKFHPILNSRDSGFNDDWNTNLVSNGRVDVGFNFWCLYRHYERITGVLFPGTEMGALVPPAHCWVHSNVSP